MKGNLSVYYTIVDVIVIFHVVKNSSLDHGRLQRY